MAGGAEESFDHHRDQEKGKKAEEAVLFLLGHWES